jgi:hypothetical protein
MTRARELILSLAARRKGIARSAVLHLDCARSAEGGHYRFALEKQLLFLSNLPRQRESEMRRSSCAMFALTRSSSSGAIGRPSFSSIR